MVFKHEQSGIFDLRKYLHKMLIHLKLGILLFITSTSLFEIAHGCGGKRRSCRSKLSVIIVARFFYASFVHVVRISRHKRTQEQLGEGSVIP